MSLHLEFTPHSWYKGFAIKRNKLPIPYQWSAYTANGNTGYIDEEHADTLKELKELITRYENDRKEHIAHIYRKRS